jgi:hypothetical protein
MNTKNLETLYAGFDLHYDKSDDHSVWSKGHRQWQAICYEEQRLIHGGLASVDEIEVIKSKYF